MSTRTQHAPQSLPHASTETTPHSSVCCTCGHLVCYEDWLWVDEEPLMAACPSCRSPIEVDTIHAGLECAPRPLDIDLADECA